MRHARNVVFTAALAVLLLARIPSTAFAQASIAGTVKDTSGAVLPGVTVEAASPVLIEKVRTAVADGTGQYQIADLRPGTYTVTVTDLEDAVIAAARRAPTIGAYTVVFSPLFPLSLEDRRRFRSLVERHG